MLMASCVCGSGDGGVDQGVLPSRRGRLPRSIVMSLKERLFTKISGIAKLGTQALVPGFGAPAVYPRGEQGAAGGLVMDDRIAYSD